MQQLGRYEILEELGHGAMGTVYRARDPEIDRIVALKTVRVAGLTSEQEQEYRRRFFREAQSAGKLSHRGIVTIYDMGEDKATQTPYIVMEYIEGRTLESFLTDPALPPLSWTESLQLIQQVAEALDYAHTREIVHRDIKPANILVTPDGQPKITDFGIAKLRKSDFTVPGQILGTLAYLAPEQLQGIPVDGRADLFSLGVILYWLLTGRRPFEGDTNTVLYQVACLEPPPVTDVNPELPAEVNRVVSRSLAKDPDRRYQRGMEFAEDLDDLVAGRAPRWATESPPTAAAEKTVVESRPLAPRAMEKTLVERRRTVSATHPHPAAGSPVRRASQFVRELFHRTSRRGRIAVAAGILL
ncbi:MAG: serine/threonine-protein kinase, partial [Terriglobia bacterium]